MDSREIRIQRLAYHGRSVTVGSGDPVYDQARTLVQLLHEQHAEPLDSISGRSGVPHGTPGRIAAGYRVYSRTALAILRLQPHTPACGHGPYVPAIGLQRRLQALAAEGWSLPHIGSSAGIHPRYVWQLTARPGLTILSQTDRKVRALYDQAERIKPEEAGATAMIAERTRGRALRCGYAPRHCWDWDTIDDPDAVPEWTGACGTPDGYAIHIRDSIRVTGHDGRLFGACKPCRLAHRATLK